MTSMLPTAEAFAARILYRDACMLILDKPAGIAVHVTAHDKIALDQGFTHLQFGLPRPPALAHRLDRATSGCLVLGRHRKALARLGKLFENQRVEKTYLAIVVGAPPEPEGVVNIPILKTGSGGNWRMELRADGQEAVSHYRLLSSGNGISVLELSPKTGRTHQLRLHCKALGCPILGDPFYGTLEGEFSAAAVPMQLHAHRICVPYYPKKPAIMAEAPVPLRMQEFMQQAGDARADHGAISRP